MSRWWRPTLHRLLIVGSLCFSVPSVLLGRLHSNTGIYKVDAFVPHSSIKSSWVTSFAYRHRHIGCLQLPSGRLLSSCCSHGIGSSTLRPSRHPHLQSCSSDTENTHSIEDSNIDTSIIENGVTKPTLNTSENNDLTTVQSTISNTSTSNSEEMTTENQLSFAILLLNVLAIIWGTQHSVIKMVVDDSDAAAFSFVRFFLGSLFATFPIIQASRNHQLPIDKDSKEDTDKSSLVWRWGLEMGFWMMLGYTFQAIGLQYTTAQRSGFLLYLNVKFVPFFANIFFQRQISISTWLSAFIALLGTFLLSFDGKMSPSSINVGDLWSIAAAAASAMFILRLETASKAIENGSKLNAASLWVVTFASLTWCIVGSIQEEMRESISKDIDVYLSESLLSVWHKVTDIVASHPIEIIYLGGVTTALANYIQTKAQRDVSAERASLIYALDPVYGAGFAYILLGEELSRMGVIGASLITFAAVTNALFDFGAESDNQQ